VQFSARRNTTRKPLKIPKQRWWFDPVSPALKKSTSKSGCGDGAAAPREYNRAGRHITALVPGNPLPVKAFIKQRMRVRRIVIRRG